MLLAPPLLGISSNSAVMASHLSLYCSGLAASVALSTSVALDWMVARSVFLMSSATLPASTPMPTIGAMTFHMATQTRMVSSSTTPQLMPQQASQLKPPFFGGAE